MNPLQTFAVILCCSAVIVIKMSLLMAQGIPLLMALLLVYLVAVVFMLGLQHRARQSCEFLQETRPVTVLPEPARASSGTGRLTVV